MHPHHKDQTTAHRMSKVSARNKVARREEDGTPTATHESTYLRSVQIIERLGGKIRSGSLEYFFDHILPPTKPELDVEHIYDSCIKKKILSKKRGSEEYTWVGIRKNLKGIKAHKTRFINIFRAVIGAAQGATSTHFDILDSVSEVKTGGDKKKGQEAVIYLGDTHESGLNACEEERLYNSSFSFHFKNSSSKEDTYDVRYILYIMNNNNEFYL